MRFIIACTVGFMNDCEFSLGSSHYQHLSLWMVEVWAKPPSFKLGKVWETPPSFRFSWNFLRIFEDFGKATTYFEWFEYENWLRFALTQIYAKKVIKQRLLRGPSSIVIRSEDPSSVYRGEIPWLMCWSEFQTLKGW